MSVPRPGMLLTLLCGIEWPPYSESPWTLTLERLHFPARFLRASKDCGAMPGRYIVAAHGRGLTPSVLTPEAEDQKSRVGRIGHPLQSAKIKSLASFAQLDTNRIACSESLSLKAPRSTAHPWYRVRGICLCPEFPDLRGLPKMTDVIARPSAVRLHLTPQSYNHPEPILVRSSPSQRTSTIHKSRFSE
ncbi:hypothetical protein PM082_020287 [Marasmius tenuissimus]|nr:hypothetical protein PM082_020287 [Marasmius tenuissimus]